MFKSKPGALKKFCKIVFLKLGVVEPEEVSKTNENSSPWQVLNFLRLSH